MCLSVQLDVTRTPSPYGNCIDATEADNLALNMYATEYDISSYTDKVNDALDAGSDHDFSHKK
jgi:hypothetical protein